MEIEMVLDCPKCHSDMNLEEELHDEHLWIYKCEKCKSIAIHDLIKATYNNNKLW